jgi:hypothetical protein
MECQGACVVADGAKTAFTSMSCARSTLLEWLLALVIAAAVASAWRGAWLGVDAVLLRSSLRASAAVSLAAGSAQFLACVATQERLAAWSRQTSRRRALWAMDATYSYLSFWSCVLVWRGVWELWTCAFQDGVWDMHPEPLPTRQLWTACVSHVAGIAVLLVLGGVRNLNAPPMLVCSDTAGPFLGASMTPGLGRFRPLDRLREPFPEQEAAAWYDAVGIPRPEELDAL